MEKDIQNRAHDKAFATIYGLDNDISRLKQEIKDNQTPFITIEQLQSVLNHTKKQRDVWDYIASLIEKDHEKVDYFDIQQQLS